MAFIKYIGALLLFSSHVQAQSLFSDLFGQAKKQNQYYRQQIAAYQALRTEINQGYGVLQRGLNGISDINTAELHAHTAYYTSLKTPSAGVKNNKQVAQILTYQTDITAVFSRTYTELTRDEADYVAAVKKHVLSACEKDMTGLKNLLATGQLQMRDDERLKRLNTIHAAMLDRYEFSQSFTNSLKILAIRRQQNRYDNQTMIRLYENR